MKDCNVLQLGILLLTSASNTMRWCLFGILAMGYGVENTAGWIANPPSSISSFSRCCDFFRSSIHETGTTCDGATLSSSALFATCRICRKSYEPLSNGASSCVYHPGSLRGESPRKSDWEDEQYDKDGRRKIESDSETNSKQSIDNSKLVYTYTCCGGESDSEGCTRSRCMSFDDP